MEVDSETQSITDSEIGDLAEQALSEKSKSTPIPQESALEETRQKLAKGTYKKIIYFCPNTGKCFTRIQKT